MKLTGHGPFFDELSAARISLFCLEVGSRNLDIAIRRSVPWNYGDF